METTSHQDIPVGRIVSVSGSQVIILLDGSLRAGGTFASRQPDIGALVKMRTAASTVFGVVSGLSIPVPKEGADEAEMWMVEAELLGESPTRDDGESLFRRGVSNFPALGGAVFEAGQDDLRHVYACPGRSIAKIGIIHQDSNLPAYLAIDDLLGKHFAILGTTGSGKSCAVALILRAVLSRHPNGHVLLLDPHNEYAHGLGDISEVLNPANFELPYWLLNFEEIREIMIGRQGGDPEVEAAILRDTIVEAKRRYRSDASIEALTADTPVPYRLSDFNALLDEAMGRIEKAVQPAPYLRLRARLASLQSDARFAFMFPGLSVRDNMTTILGRLFRIPVGGRPITIVDLSAVPSEVLNVVVSLLCRMTMDYALWSDQAVPILLVCEEAHRYAPLDLNLGFEPSKRALSRIAKEGRKYGLGLCVVSQRPSELAAGMLSQCNTIFALRMSNQSDQTFVRSTLSESAAGLMDSLPALRNQEAIVVGEGVPVPLRMFFDDLPPDHRPLNGAARFTAAWDHDVDGADHLQEVVRRWRRQRR